jgi:hypothetical protein
MDYYKYSLRTICLKQEILTTFIKTIILTKKNCIKKITFSIVTFIMLTIIGFSQTAKTFNDYFGNKTTTYSISYGQNIGTAKTSTDYFGNTNTTYSVPTGQTTGTAKSSTDYFGNTNTIYWYRRLERTLKHLLLLTVLNFAPSF